MRFHLEWCVRQGFLGLPDTEWKPTTHVPARKGFASLREAERQKTILEMQSTFVGYRIVREVRKGGVKTRTPCEAD